MSRYEREEVFTGRTTDGRPVTVYEQNTMYFAFVGGVNAGTASLSDDGTYLGSVHVEPRFRRQGIATVLYRGIEHHIGHKLRPSPTYQSDDAKAFWSRRNPSRSGDRSYHGGAARYHVEIQVDSQPAQVVDTADSRKDAKRYFERAIRLAFNPDEGQQVVQVWLMDHGKAVEYAECKRNEMQENPEQSNTDWTPAELEEAKRLKSYFPFRIVYLARLKDGAAEINAVTTMRRPNALARQGLVVGILS